MTTCCNEAFISDIYIYHAVLDDKKIVDELPLTTRELTILNSNQSYLVRSLKIDDQDMLMRMSENGCVSPEQMSYLKKKHLAEKRNRAILDIIKRRSLRSYRQFIDCLRLSKYPCNINAAQILEHGEGETPIFHFVKLVLYGPMISRRSSKQPLCITSLAPSSTGPSFPVIVKRTTV